MSQLDSEALNESQCPCERFGSELWGLLCSEIEEYVHSCERYVTVIYVILWKYVRSTFILSLKLIPYGDQ